MFEYVEQDPNSGYARHDLGGSPEPYTYSEMTYPAPHGFAMLNRAGKVEASIFNANLSKVLDGIYTIDPDTFIATKKDSGITIKVDFDAKNGVWFKLA